jgi:hypothetical protein
VEYTEGERERFKAEFALRRRNQIRLLIPVGAVALAATVGRDRAAQTIFGVSIAQLLPLFVLAAFGLLGFSLWNWRCPACHKYLGRGLGPRHCSSCGIALRD